MQTTLRRAAAVLVLLGSGLLGTGALGSTPAAAPAAADGSIASLDAAIDVDARGDLHVTETITYAADGAGHLPRRTLPQRIDPGGAVDGEDHRAYRVSDIAASDSTGTPTRVTVLSCDHHAVTIQVGDPAQPPRGTQTYVLRYTVRDVVAAVPSPSARPGDPAAVPPDVLALRAPTGATGTPIDRVTVRVTAPRPAVAARCAGGAGPGDTLPCTATAGTVSTFSARDLGGDLDVVVDYPPGTVTGRGAMTAPTVPLVVTGPVTDQIGALGGDAARVRSALDALAARSGIHLFVLYVDQFPGGAVMSADRIDPRSQLRLSDAAFAVAADCGDSALHRDADAFPLTDAAVDALMARQVQPRLDAHDWAGATVALADGLRAPYDHGDAAAYRLLVGLIRFGLAAAVAVAFAAALRTLRAADPLAPTVQGGALPVDATLRRGAALAVLVIALDPVDRAAALGAVAVAVTAWSAGDGYRFRSRVTTTWLAVCPLVAAAWWVQKLVLAAVRPGLLAVTGFDAAALRDTYFPSGALAVLATPVVVVLLVVIAGVGAAAGRLSRRRP